MTKGIGGLAVDVDDVVWAHAHFFRYSVSGYESRLKHEVTRVVELLARHGSKATFFVPGYALELVPDLLDAAVAQGHEMACHGFQHVPVNRHTPESFEQDLQESMHKIESSTGIVPIGYRAPGMSLLPAAQWAVPILIRNGIVYSSSTPAVAVGQHGWRIGRAKPFKWPGGLEEIPPSTQSVLGIGVPVCGTVFARFMPDALLRLLTKRFISAGQQPIIYYFHPFEAIPDHLSEALLHLGLRERIYLWGCHGYLSKLEWMLDTVEFGTYQSVFRLLKMEDCECQDGKQS